MRKVHVFFIILQFIVIFCQFVWPFLGVHLGLYVPKNLYWHPGSYNDTVDDITAIAVGVAWGVVRLLV